MNLDSLSKQVELWEKFARRFSLEIDFSKYPVLPEQNGEFNLIQPPIKNNVWNYFNLCKEMIPRMQMVGLKKMVFRDSPSSSPSHNWILISSTTQQKNEEYNIFADPVHYLCLARTLLQYCFMHWVAPENIKSNLSVCSAPIFMHEGELYSPVVYASSKMVFIGHKNIKLTRGVIFPRRVRVL